MPFILMRRTDIPNGVLQLQDLVPNAMNRNALTDPPAQSGYVRRVPDLETVVTVGADPILILRDVCGLAAYLIDNVEDSSGSALAAAVANDAAAAIVARVGLAQDLTLADIDAELAAAGATAGTGLEAGASTGSLADLMSLLQGSKYFLPAGASVEAGGAFIPGPRGYFESRTRVYYVTGAFNISNAEGRLAKMKEGVTWGNVFAPAIVVYNDDGEVI